MDEKTIIKLCPCGKSIKVIYSLRLRKKYCSRICQRKYKIRRSGLKYILKKENPTSFKRGMIPHNKGKPNYYQMKENPSCCAIHEWVNRWKKDPQKCEMCGNKGRLDWSNITHTYKRDLSDWQRLCRKCHFKYDNEHFGIKRGRKKK